MTRSIYGFAVQESPVTAPLRVGGGIPLTVERDTGLVDGPPSGSSEVVRWRERPGVVFHGSVHSAPDDTLYIETSDAGWFRLDPARPAIWHARDPSDVAVQVRTWVTPMLLSMTHLGRLPLHAAAVRTAEGVVAIGAPGKHGKTTLVAALHAAGCPLYAEDITCIDGRSVLAGPGLIRLRPDAEGHVDISGLVELGRTSDRIFLHDTSPQPDPAPLRAVVLLRQGDEMSLVPRTGPTLLPDLWTLSFHLPSADDRTRAFDRLAGVAAGIEVYDLVRPLVWNSLAGGVDLLLDRFGGPG